MNLLLLHVAAVVSVAYSNDGTTMKFRFSGSFTRIMPAFSDYLQQICGKQKYDSDHLPGAVSIWHTDANNPQNLDNGKLEDFCNGMLISDRHVISAANCFFRNDSRYPPRRQPQRMQHVIRITAGGTCNFEWGKGDPCVGEEFKKRKYIHDSKVRAYAVPTMMFKEYYANDLVVLELEMPITLDNRISPLCLPHEDEIYTHDAAIYQMGTGWNEYDRSSANIQFKKSGFLGEPIKNDSSHRILAMVPLDIDGHGWRPTTGDTGSGLVYNSPTDARMYAIGVLSRAGRTKSYTDLRHFVDLMCAQTGVCYMKQSVGNSRQQRYSNDSISNRFFNCSLFLLFISLW